MKKCIKKNFPVFLIEYNLSNFKKIYNFLKKYYNSILTKGNSIIAISKHIEKTILESFPNPTIKNKITVVHRGVDLELFNANNIKPARVIAQSKNLNLKPWGFKILIKE